jgi:hypothetical protein
MVESSIVIDWGLVDNQAGIALARPAIVPHQWLLQAIGVIGRLALRRGELQQ